jgi:hypothetical protein
MTKMTKHSLFLANILDNLQPYLVLTSPSMKSLSTLAFVVMLAPRLALALNAQNFIIDPSPPVAPLEKTVDYFTSTTIPSVVLGSSSGDGGPGGYRVSRNPQIQPTAQRITATSAVSIDTSALQPAPISVMAGPQRLTRVARCSFG